MTTNPILQTPQLTAEEESTVSGLVSSLAQLETRRSLVAKLHPNGQPSKHYDLLPCTRSTPLKSTSTRSRDHEINSH